MRLLKYLFIFFLCTSVAWADDPDGLISYPPNQIMGFRGLDTKSQAPNIPDSRAEDLQNVKLSAALDLQKRYGYSVVNGTLDEIDTDSPPIQGIFDTEFSDGSSKTIVFAGTKIKYDNAGVWSDVTGGTRPTSGQNNRFQCVMALDNAICTNDADLPVEINSTPVKSDLDTSDLSDSLDKAKTLIWYRNYLIFGNTVENGTERPTRFRWSDVGTTETYQDDNFTDIASLAGDEIQGFAELYGELYIFLRRSIWQASLVGGNDVFIFKKVFDFTGAASRDSIRIVNLSDNRQVVIFLDERKRVFMFNGVNLIDIGSIIQTTLNTLNETQLDNAVATFDGDSYYLSAATSGQTTNDVVFEYQAEILEWTKHTDIEANVFAQVKESTSVIKTYFGNTKGFVYWLDDPDQINDVDGASGVVDSVGTVNSDIFTGAQVLLDSDLAEGIYTGATIKITSGTGAGEEAVIISGATSGVVVSSPFTTTPDSTSVYSIGAIDAYYNAKHYDMGSAQREKQMLGIILFANEQSNSEITFSYGLDFMSNASSEDLSLEPSGNSLWDVALWDQGVWGTTGDKIYTLKTQGLANYIQPKFSNNDPDQTFHLYGFNLLGVGLDTKQ